MSNLEQGYAMNLRITLYELGARHSLNAAAMRRLLVLAGLGAEPGDLLRRCRQGAAVAAGLLGGFGIICWVAANWADFGRTGRFVLLQSFLVAMCAGALLRPAARTPFGAAAILAIGALLAYFGQTYQTGADPWQLFAWWAALALPLCLSVRNDIVWALWALLATTAIALCLRAYTHYQWGGANDVAHVYFLAWCCGAVLTVFLSPVARRYSGAGIVAQRISVFLFAVALMLGAINALFSLPVGRQFWIAGLFLAFTAVILHERCADLFGLGVVALAIDVVLVAGISRVFLDSPGSDWGSAFFIVGLAATALLTATFRIILAITRRRRTDLD